MSFEIVDKAILEIEARETSRLGGVWRLFGCWPEKWCDSNESTTVLLCERIQHYS